VRQSAKGCHEVRGKTLGIVGYGHIGSQLSVMAEALGMRVIFHDIVPKLPLGNSRHVSLIVYTAALLLV
jgi:D-3-phosphoglycerate dehydrogenase